jgi:glutamyl-tRNA synthetase
MVNFLARLGWSHGDAEMFSSEQFVEWFDLEHISHSPAQFNPEKLRWLNQQYLKVAQPDDLARELKSRLPEDSFDPRTVADVAGLYRERAATLTELGEYVTQFYSDRPPPGELLAEHVTDAVKPALRSLAERFATVEPWAEEGIKSAFEGALKAHGLKMPKLAVPVRVVVFGTTHTPSLYPTLALAGKARVVERLQRYG